MHVNNVSARLTAFAAFLVFGFLSFYSFKLSLSWSSPVPVFLQSAIAENIHVWLAGLQTAEPYVW